MAKKKGNGDETAEVEKMEPIPVRVKLVVQDSGEVKFWVDDPNTLKALEAGQHYEAEFLLTRWEPTDNADGGDKPPHP